MRFYATVTTFQKDETRENLFPATSYFAGDNNGGTQERVVEYSGYIAVVQVFDNMEHAYHNVAMMKNNMAVFNKAANKVKYIV